MDILCTILGYLSPIFDLVNTVLGIFGVEIDFLGLLGCETEA